MANHRRKKTKRAVRSVLGTMYRWLGNNHGRVKPELSDHRDREKMREEIKLQSEDRSTL